MYNKNKRGWRKTCEKFSSSLSVTRSGECLTVLFQCLVLTGVGGLYLFLSARRVTHTKLKQDTATHKKQIKRVTGGLQSDGS